MLRSVVWFVLVASATVTSRAAVTDNSMLAKFEGNWSCRGTFTSSGKPIAADISIHKDGRSGAWIVHHDDVPPGPYHALEIWTANPNGARARAAVSDRFAGMRWFETPGWVGHTLTWARLERGAVVEKFAYQFVGDTMQISWSVAARGGALKLGDTLSCRRS